MRKVNINASYRELSILFAEQKQQKGCGGTDHNHSAYILFTIPRGGPEETTNPAPPKVRRGAQGEGGSGERAEAPRNGVGSGKRKNSAEERSGVLQRPKGLASRRSEARTAGFHPSRPPFFLKKKNKLSNRARPRQLIFSCSQRVLTRSWVSRGRFW